MFRLTLHSRRVTAATLLVVFLNVFFGQAVCALAMPADAAREQEHQHPVGTAPHHHDSEAADDHDAVPAHHSSNHSPSHAHKHGAKDSCCQDDAAAVWAALAHPPKAGVGKLVLLPAALPPAPLAVPVRAQRWDRSGPVLLVARRQLKPKIPDIRIFIQSLTV